MLFNSTTFILFFILVTLFYNRIHDVRKQNVFLTFCSYVFYGFWSVKFLVLILFTSSLDYFTAKNISSTENISRKKFFLAVSIISNFSLLFFFKYYNFGIESFSQLLQLIGLTPHLSTLQIILPVGISFYTFQSIGYVIDVYRNEMEAEKDYLTYVLFVSFFPQLVAGPIESAKRLIPQLRVRRAVSQENVIEGINLMTLGYFKKTVIADTMALYVDRVFMYPDSVGGISSLLSLVAFTLQIYGDFAGYSLIAIGAARILGITLMDNFNMPYIALSPKDFWKRWHISLSSWFREYVYIPLGGNRKGRTRTYINLMATMLICGLWHGASWNFVAWGAYHGALAVIYEFFGINKALRKPGVFVSIISRTVTFILVLFGWLIFRANSYAVMRKMMSNIFFNFHADNITSVLMLPVLSAFIFIMGYNIWGLCANTTVIPLRKKAFSHLLIYVYMFLMIVIVGFKYVPFVYFQF